MKAAHLKNRGLFTIKGKDALSFLQGLITNDMRLISPTRTLYAAFLTAQGKFFQDMFIVQWEDGYLIETEKGRLNSLIKKLALYKLKTDVILEDVSETFSVLAVWGEAVFEDFGVEKNPGFTRSSQDSVLYVDSRLAAMGIRVIHRKEASLPPVIEGLNASEADYQEWRLQHGIPESPSDLIPDKSIPLECNLDFLNAISWDKGCYLGQELTARTKYRGLIRKRLLPINIKGVVPLESSLYDTQGQEKGIVRSVQGNSGLALIRLDILNEETAELVTQDRLGSGIPFIPSWLKIEI